MAKGFYVTMKDAKRTAWLLGPFNEHKVALEAVAVTRQYAINMDAWAHFYAFGTSSIEADELPKGKLNDVLKELVT